MTIGCEIEEEKTKIQARNELSEVMGNPKYRNIPTPESTGRTLLLSFTKRKRQNLFAVEIVSEIKLWKVHTGYQSFSSALSNWNFQVNLQHKHKISKTESTQMKEYKKRFFWSSLPNRW